MSLVAKPSKVIHCALQNATSIVGLMLCSEAFISEKLKEEGSALSMPGRIDGMMSSAKGV